MTRPVKDAALPAKPETVHQIYTLGYQGLKQPIIYAAVESVGGWLIDIRMSPWSRDPLWKKGHLKGFDRYYHIADLGNKNYNGKHGDGIMIRDFVGGMHQLFPMAQQGPTFLMCACWNRLTCHRATVADMITDAYDLSIIHLSKHDVIDMGTPVEPESIQQLMLF